jgi:transcription elongation factor Elf1
MISIYNKYNFFKCFIECNKDKSPKGGSFLGSYKQATENSENIGGILNQGIILIDIDNKHEAELYLTYLKKCNVKTTVIKTTRGYHFYFKSNEKLKNTNHNLSILGIEYDLKNTNDNKSQYAIIKQNNQFRQIITEAEPPQLPIYFKHPILSNNNHYKESLKICFETTDPSYLNNEFIDLCNKYKMDKTLITLFYNFLNKQFFNDKSIIDTDRLNGATDTNKSIDTIKSFDSNKSVDTNKIKIDKYTIKELKTRLGDYLERITTKHKNNFFTCPFCNSGGHGYRSSPAFHIRDGQFICFSCREQGDIFNLYEKLNHVDFKTAYIDLCNMFNISIDVDTEPNNKIESIKPNNVKTIKSNDNFYLLKRFKFSSYKSFYDWIKDLLKDNKQLLFSYNKITTHDIYKYEDINTINVNNYEDFIKELKTLKSNQTILYKTWHFNIDKYLSIRHKISLSYPHLFNDAPWPLDNWIITNCNGILLYNADKNLLIEANEGELDNVIEFIFNHKNLEDRLICLH